MHAPQQKMLKQAAVSNMISNGAYYSGPVKSGDSLPLKLFEKALEIQLRYLGEQYFAYLLMWISKRTR